ncbi:3-isopropylmalate dehydrogenase [Jeotgalibacillus proteolyticus]|uniref:3-isopropylmalate dehydrogenase n=1 Tax=Jeotgalibacillus proteolyticus TaxID=2082395 RepID=A0A2S5GH00_9BACL|nr:3-isopropylmalate dehydrogenase [Jeotgalibacillus proteolyticus]PPA72185.1 3-isopropylmalate dehydrogenase [Jeotgalibacillus proteolyticus]
MEKTVAVLQGDGIGKEVTKSAVKVLQAVGRRFDHSFQVKKGMIGGEAIDNAGDPLPKETVELCEKSDAILLGAVGGPRWDQNPSHLRPEKGLLAIRKHFGLFANLRPVKAVPGMVDASPLKEHLVEQVDMMIVRELTGGLYFGEPKRKSANGAVDTLTYSRAEIERIVEKAFELARVRKGKVTSVDKANVLESSKLWREIVEEKKEYYPDIELEHILVDAAAMKMITQPSSFDVVVTENLFGDILSDEASVITGSLGMLPSASIRSDGFGLYEPVHGSAPDISGMNIANPAAAILSVAMMLKYSFNMSTEAAAVEQAVYSVYKDGYCTTDVQKVGHRVLSTTAFTDKVIEELERELVSDHIMSAYV